MTKSKKRKVVGQAFRIVSNQFGYPMYAATIHLSGQLSDNVSEAHVYDSRDNRGQKLAYYKAIAKIHGYDPEQVQVEEIQAEEVQ